MGQDRNFQVGKVKFNLGSLDELSAAMESLHSEEYSPYVVFVGLPGVVSAKKNEECCKAYAGADLVCADGMPIVKVAKRFGSMSCERCAGPDIMKKVLRDGLKKNARHFFYGATEEANNRLIQALKEELPGLLVAGSIAPPFRPLTEEEDRKYVDMINEAKPDYVWIGLGSPKQDIWMMNHRDKIKGSVMAGVGAAFKFHSNSVKRAPLWVQKIGMEWFYRILKEPKLFKRYFGGLPVFMGIVARDLASGTYRKWKTEK